MGTQSNEFSKEQWNAIIPTQERETKSGWKMRNRLCIWYKGKDNNESFLFWPDKNFEYYPLYPKKDAQPSQVNISMQQLFPNNPTETRERRTSQIPLRDS